MRSRLPVVFSKKEPRQRYVRIIKAMGIFHCKQLSPEEARACCQAKYGFQPRLGLCATFAPILFEVNAGHPLWDSRLRLPDEADKEMGDIAREIKSKRSDKTTSRLADLVRASDETDTAFAVINICDGLTSQARGCIRSAWPLVQQELAKIKGPESAFAHAVAVVRQFPTGDITREAVAENRNSARTNSRATIPGSRTALCSK